RRRFERIDWAIEQLLNLSGAVGALARRGGAFGAERQARGQVFFQIPLVVRIADERACQFEKLFGCPGIQRLVLAALNNLTQGLIASGAQAMPVFGVAAQLIAQRIEVRASQRAEWAMSSD